MGTATGYTKTQADTLLAAKAPLASPAFTGTPTKSGAALATTSDIATAINNLVSGAPTALDTLAEIAAQLGNDETAATALTGLVNARAIVSTVALTSAGALTGSARNTLDGSGGAFTATLPAPSKVGQLLLAERVDTGTATVTLAAATGATLRGNAGGTIAMPGVGVAFESVFFVAESLTSWAVLAGHKPKGWLDAVYAQALEPVTANPTSGTAVTLVGTGVNDVTLTGNATLTFPSLPPAGSARTFMVVLRQDGTGARTVTWPGTVKWPGGITPTLTAAAGKADVFTFSSVDGTSWLGFPGGLNF